MPRRIDPEYWVTLDELVKSPRNQDPRRPLDGVRRQEPERGSPEYLQRRQREGEQDLRDNPRRGR